jgi:hypothetical protein
MSEKYVFEKLKFIAKCVREKINGYEGCTRCNDPGYYLAMYSPEGYCQCCEAEYFPERFYPCPCCRLPQSTQSICIYCRYGLNMRFTDNRQIEEWMRTYSLQTKRGDFILAKYINKKTGFPFLGTIQEWPGFYMGNKTWEKLDYLPELDENGIVIIGTSVWSKIVGFF